MIDLVKLFCIVDDFWKNFEPQWKQMLIQHKIHPPKCPPKLSMSELITILILFHLVGYRNFKTFYCGYVRTHLKREFPTATSYTRMLELKKTAIFPLHCLLLALMGECTGISFIDSTSLQVCHVKRASSHRVFKKVAHKGKSTKGWFYGIKLHLVVNEKGELLAFVLTPGNVHDRKPVIDLAKNLFGKLTGDRGYISKKLGEELLQKGIQLITRIKRNMKNKLMSLYDKFLLQKRGIVDSVIGRLKYGSQIEHSRHRSPVNFVANLLSGLIAYSLQPKKPSIKMCHNEAIDLKV